MSIHYGLRLGPQKPLAQFLEEIKAMVMDYANSIRERQNLPAVVQIKEIPDRGPTKIGCGVRQIEEQSQALIPHFCGIPGMQG